MRIRPTLVVAISAMFVLVGCQDRDGAGESGAVGQQERPQLGTDSTCQRASTRPPTRPFQTISVEEGEIVVEPEVTVQPPRAGIFGWMSEEYHWRVTYKGEAAPIERDRIMRVGGEDAAEAATAGAPSMEAAQGMAAGDSSEQASVEVRGVPGQLVWAGVRESAPCRRYDFEVQVWGGDLEDTLSRDPGNMVEPW